MKTEIISISEPLWLKILQIIPHDIYHLPEYIHLESLRLNATPEGFLIVDEENIFFVPYLLRNCNDLFKSNLENQIFDIVSPYGYPGILLSQSAARTPEFLDSAMNQLKLTLQERGVCSAFFRLHPILNDGLERYLPANTYKLHGKTVSVDLNLAETEMWHQTRPEHRTKINRCKKAGFKVNFVSFHEYIDEFISIYTETMDRVGATQSYYFDREYFGQLLKLEDLLHLCIVESEEKIICVGLFTESCGIVQYHLGATKNQFLKQSPTQLMFDRARIWAKNRGNNILHLGGGVSGSEDGLFRFKAGFSKQRHTFITLHLIINQEKYDYLVDLQAKLLNTQAEELFKSNFFPAYRCII